MLIYFALGMAHATHASITFDEGPHLAIGYATLRTGDFRLQPVHIHPPLANVLAAAPLLLQSDLPDPRAVDGWEIASLSAITDAVVWQYPHPARMATAGRVPMLLLSVLLGALIYRWAKDLGGWRAGLLALTLFTFDPNCIAHGSLITTDMPAVFFMVATMYAASGEWRMASGEWRMANGKWRMANGEWRMAAVGVLLGVAQLAKVSALMLVPVVGVLLLIQGLANEELRITNCESRITNHASRITIHVLRTWAVVFGIAALVVWAGYGFEISAVPGGPFPLPAGTHARIFQSLREHYELGHPTFLMGRVSNHGWWWYFPVAFVLKTPLPILFLGFWAVLRLMLECWNAGMLKRLNVKAFERANVQTLACRTLPGLSLFLFPVLYALSSLFSTVNIGYRHLLPLLPFLYVGLGVWSTKYGVGSRNGEWQMANDKWQMTNGELRITHHASRITHHASRIPPYSLLLTPYSLLLTSYSLLLLWLIIGTLAVSPHFLTFFNEIAGGARGGYRYLVDSNLDWGQNLWDLRAWMDAHGEDHVYYAHYSPARLDVYGINADFLPPDPRAVAFAPWNPAPGLYAIGATVLQGPYAPDVNTYAWFRGREPLTRLGNALWLYRVPPRETPTWAVLCAGVSFSSDTVAQRLGGGDLRVLWPDCAHTSVYPPGQQPGVLIASPDTAVPPRAEVDVTLRSAGGETESVVYRLSGSAPTPETPLSAVEVDGPLDFLGYTLHAETVTPGDAILLETYWRVRDVPGRPLSLLAHLLGPDGSAVAVGDGLGFPIEQWQPGDVIVQRHSLAVPVDARPGTYTVITGAYWLDTMERWTITDATGQTGDTIRLYRFERRE
ncbi:MAG TPA: phospholipid carrier-dependent glycosyltransferase [Anaerolineae bacterium]|nr:phospholipid carrier-dependent glycosyltransferase [Anaerolineae bacterium]